jgi:signal transduction histidine kinase
VGVTLELDLPVRPSESIEIGAYYLVSEALTNAAKHAQASSVSVSVSEADDQLTVSVADDGLGGARIVAGSGLEGLIDRVEALGGRLVIDSPAGRGTRISAVFPLELEIDEHANSPRT